MVENLSYPVVLYLSGSHLEDAGATPSSQISCQVFIKYDNKNGWDEVGTTEIISDDSSPKWLTTITVPYWFEKVQNILFRINDSDSLGLRLGSAETTLSELANNEKTEILLDCYRAYGVIHNKKGKLCIRAERVSNASDTAYIELKGRHLDKKDFFSASDPYFILYRLIGEDKLKVYQSEVIDNDLNPTWIPFQLPLQQMCGGDPHNHLLIEVWDYDSPVKSQFIGSSEISLHQILQGGSIELKTQKKKKSGYIDISSARVTRKFNFLDYLRTGTKINVIVAVDFGKNEKLHKPPSKYEQALLAVGSVLEGYDSDKLFSIFGFAGMFRGSSEMSECCPLNGNDQNPEVLGVQGMIDAYRDTLNDVKFGYLTKLAGIMRKAEEIAMSNDGRDIYHVLVVLTSGKIYDTYQVTHAIEKNLTKLPVSIVIIGVETWEADYFTSLDGDIRIRLPYSGHDSSRDITQFVSFEEFENMPERFASEVLAEIPKQLVEYMETKGIGKTEVIAEVGIN